MVSSDDEVQDLAIVDEDEDVDDGEAGSDGDDDLGDRRGIRTPAFRSGEVSATTLS